MAVFHSASGRRLASRVEWMRTPKERTCGMLKFNEAPADYAAIFELPLNGFFPLIHTIGMKFPIDMLFCSKEGRVLECKSQVPPLRFALPPLKNLFGGAHFLLEFSKCDLSPVKVGDQISWESPS